MGPLRSSGSFHWRVTLVASTEVKVTSIGDPGTAGKYITLKEKLKKIYKGSIRV